MGKKKEVMEVDTKDMAQTIKDMFEDLAQTDLEKILVTSYNSSITARGHTSTNMSAKVAGSKGLYEVSVKTQGHRPELTVNKIKEIKEPKKEPNQKPNNFMKELKKL